MMEQEGAESAEAQSRKTHRFVGISWLFSLGLSPDASSAALRPPVHLFFSERFCTAPSAVFRREVA